jgi:hypothetical protein
MLDTGTVLVLFSSLEFTAPHHSCFFILFSPKKFIYGHGAHLMLDTATVLVLEFLLPHLSNCSGHMQRKVTKKEHHQYSKKDGPSKIIE